MTGIKISGLTEWATVYQVLSPDGEVVEINNTAFFKIDGQEPGSVLLNFTESSGMLESLISYYTMQYERIADIVDRQEASNYVTLKQATKASIYGKEMGAEGRKEPTDKLCWAVTINDPRFKELVGQRAAVKEILTQLQTSLRILSRTWEAARSLNANERAMITL